MTFLVLRLLTENRRHSTSYQRACGSWLTESGVKLHFPGTQYGRACRKACRERVTNIVANLSQRSNRFRQPVEQMVRFTLGDD